MDESAGLLGDLTAALPFDILRCGRIKVAQDRAVTIGEGHGTELRPDLGSHPVRYNVDAECADPRDLDQVLAVGLEGRGERVSRLVALLRLHDRIHCLLSRRFAFQTKPQDLVLVESELLLLLVYWLGELGALPPLELLLSSADLVLSDCRSGRHSDFHGMGRLTARLVRVYATPGCHGIVSAIG